MLVTVMLMALTLTVAVHVYCPASEVLREFKKSVTVLLVLTASTLVLFRAESPLTALLLPLLLIELLTLMYYVSAVVIWFL